MGKGIVYIAMSIDGYIARENGSVDRLDAFPNPDSIDYGYAELLENVDTILLGKNTYLQILGFDEKWPYDEYATYVMSRDPDLEITTPNTHIINGLSPETVQKLHAKSQKNIWIMGGGVVISQCLDLGVVDEMIISIVPIILGKGIPLFPDAPKQIGFDVVKCETHPTGIVTLQYSKKELLEE